MKSPVVVPLSRYPRAIAAIADKSGSGVCFLELERPAAVGLKVTPPLVLAKRRPSAINWILAFAGMTSKEVLAKLVPLQTS